MAASTALEQKAPDETGLPFEVVDAFWLTWKAWGEYECIIHQGGTSSSKTYSILQVLLLKAMERKRHITIIGQDMPNLRVGAIKDMETIIESAPKLKAYILNDGKMNKSISTYVFKNGSKIEFKSYESGQDARSGKRDIAFFNEVNGISKDIYDEIVDRTYEITLMDFNPNARFWVHTDIVPEPGTVLFITNFTHNRFCPPKTIRKLLYYKRTNKYRWQVYGLGLTGIVEGTVYTHINWVKRELWPGDENMDHFGFAVDYGYANDPMAFVKAGLYQGKVYAMGLLYKTGVRLEDLAASFDFWNVGFELISMDDSQAKEQADLLREDYGFNVKSANRRSGSINSGIALLKDYSLNIIYDKDWQAEQDNYKWSKERSTGDVQAKPIDKWNHYFDALRYWALDNLTELEAEPFEEEVIII
jgi:phage terminase large subunit